MTRRRDDPMQAIIYRGEQKENQKISGVFLKKNAPGYRIEYPGALKPTGFSLFLPLP